MDLSGKKLVMQLEQRGLIAQYSGDENLAAHLDVSRTLYCGFDPTADSLHIGSLVPLLMLKRFQEGGHRPIILVGGSTGLIGDPSFKAEERKLNSPEIVAGWVEKIRHQTSQFVDFDESLPNGAIIVNNLDWTAGIDVRSIDYVELNPKKPINPARLRQQATEQKARIEAFVEEILGRESTDLNDLWFATIVTIIAAIRAHQADTLVMSNGIFALGRLAQSATGLKNYVGILRGVETIVNSMAMHDHDNIMASNGCLAIARICHLPDIDSREDKELAQKALDTNAEIQEKALTEGALNAVLTAEVRHGASKLV